MNWIAYGPSEDEPHAHVVPSPAYILEKCNVMMDTARREGLVEITQGMVDAGMAFLSSEWPDWPVTVAAAEDMLRGLYASMIGFKEP